MDDLSQLSNALGLAVLLVVVGLIAIDCKKDIRQLVAARNVFIITIMAWYLLEACLVPDALLIYAQGQYHFALACVLICIASFLFGYHNTKGKVFDPIFRRLAAIDDPKLIWTVFLFALAIGFLPLMVFAKGNVLLILEDAFNSKSRWSGVFQRGRYGGVRDAFLELRMFLRAALPFAAVVLAGRKFSGEKRALALFFISYMVANAINDGTRSKVLEALMPVAAVIYWRMPPPVKRRALLFGLPCIVVGGLFWSAASVLGRNEGRLAWEQATSAEYVGFEMFRELLWLQEAIPDQAPLQYGHTYYVQIVNPIPRAVWPGKPVGDAGLLMAEIRESVQNGADLTISPGMIGEMYWNFHIPGIVLLSFLCGFLAKAWDRIRPLATQSLLAFTVFAAGLAVIFLSGRAFTMATIYGMLALYVVLLIFAKGRRFARSNRMVANRQKNPESGVAVHSGANSQFVRRR